MWYVLEKDWLAHIGEVRVAATNVIQEDSR